MLKSNASRGVLVILLVIAGFELGISGKFGQVWSLAFSASHSKPAPGSLNPGAPAPGASPGGPLGGPIPPITV